MANRDAKPVRSPNTGFWPIAGKFTTDGAGAVLTQTPTGLLIRNGIFTITKPAGTGIYQVQLDGFNDILHADANVWVAAGTLNADIQPILPLTPSNGIVQFQGRQTSNGAPLDLLSALVTFVIFAKNSSVSP